MDVDLNVVRTRMRLPPDEYKKLVTEGRCFHCKQRGHLSRSCPDKTGKTASGSSKGKTAEKPKNKAKIRQATIEEVVDDHDPEEDDEKEDPPAYTADKVEATIRALSTNEREKLYEQLAALEGF